jgi:hypothetical protein
MHETSTKYQTTIYDFVTSRDFRMNYRRVLNWRPGLLHTYNLLLHFHVPEILVV